MTDAIAHDGALDVLAGRHAHPVRDRHPGAHGGARRRDGTAPGARPDGAERDAAGVVAGRHADRLPGLSSRRGLRQQRHLDHGHERRQPHAPHDRSVSSTSRPEWTADGKRITYSHFETDGFRLRIDGSRWRRRPSGERRAAGRPLRGAAASRRRGRSTASATTGRRTRPTSTATAPIDLDLPAMGADPRHKDLFLELDFMPPHRLAQGAVDRMELAFAAAPVPNPDGTTGITLHVDNGPGSTMDPAHGRDLGVALGSGVARPSGRAGLGDRQRPLRVDGLRRAQDRALRGCAPARLPLRHLRARSRRHEQRHRARHPEQRLPRHARRGLPRPRPERTAPSATWHRPAP